MRKTGLASLLLLAAAVGALVHAAWMGGATARDDGNVPRESREAPVAAAPEPRFDALNRRMDAVETQLRLLREESLARGRQGSAEYETLLARLSERGTAGPAKTDVAPIDESPRAVEELRTRWLNDLTELDRKLDDMVKAGADPREVVMWSRLDEAKRARAALVGALDMTALRQLAEGWEFKPYFRLTTEPGK
jgi:hypothetical protein